MLLTRRVGTSRLSHPYRDLMIVPRIACSVWIIGAILVGEVTSMHNIITSPPTALDE